MNDDSFYDAVLGKGVDSSVSLEDEGSFTELSNYINSQIQNENYVIDLNKSYTFSEGDEDLITGININNPLTIHGNNFIISGNNSARIFNIHAANVILSDIAFVDGYANFKSSNYENCGAAIVSAADNLTITNCNFNGGYAGGYGSAILIGNRLTSSNVNIIDCTFEDNCADVKGAIYVNSGNNVNIVNSNFINNTALQDGGAIYTAGNNVTIDNCIFVRNAAVNDGGAIHVKRSGSNTKIVNSVFDDNFAFRGAGVCTHQNYTEIENCNFNDNTLNCTLENQGGGAICLDDSNYAVVKNSNFTGNYANFSGGAIFVIGTENVVIDGCIFIKNIAYHEGGAVFLKHDNNSVIKNCNFLSNEVTYSGNEDIPGGYGGAIRAHGVNLTIMNSNFDSNIVLSNAGGAVEYWGVNITIIDSSFNNNSAHSDGGAMYIHSTGFANITGCTFTNNFVVDDKNKKTGGAILLRKYPENSYPLESYVTDCVFEDNVAPLYAGALCIRSETYNTHYAVVDNCVFDGNNATKGSAIFIYKKCKVDVINDVFGKNRADSSKLDIEVFNPINYYPGNVTVNVTFKGNDNIANAIWNDATSNPNNVRISNITYETYIEGELFNITTPFGLVNPVLGAGNSQNGEKIWQDPYENAQKINVLIVPVIENDELLMASSNAEDILGEPVVNVTGSLSDIKSNVTLLLQNLDVGKYKVYAKHLCDEYYTEISNTEEFEVIDLLDVSKITEDVEVDVGENVTYTIVVTNNGDETLGNVSVKENVPEGFILRQYSDTWSKTDDTFIYDGILNPHDTITLELVFEATEVGEFINTISLATNITNPIEVNSTKTRVYSPNMTVNKKADDSVINIGDKAVFTIEVTNTGDRLLNDVFVSENFDSALIYDGYVSINGEWSFNDNAFALKSLGVGESASFKVYFNTTISGNFENAVVAGFENKTQDTSKDNVTVEKIPTEVTVGNITAHPGDDVVIPVNVTSEDGVPFNGNITVVLPDESNKTVEIINGSGEVPWTVPYGYEGDYPVDGSYPGDDKYLPSNGTGIVTVVKIPTEVDVGNITAHPGDDVVIPVNVTLDDGVPFNGEINITLPDGSVVPVEIVNGTGEVPWTVPYGYEGDYPVDGSYPGDGRYLPSNGTGIVNIEKIPTHISIENITARPGDDVVIHVNVTADDGIPFNGNITIDLPDGSSQSIEIVNGTGNIYWTIPDNYSGEYPVNGSFEGDGRYLPSDGTGIITVIPKIPTDVTVGNITSYPGDDVVIPVNVTSEDDVPFNGNITVVLPDGSDKTVEIVNGSGEVPWTIPDDYEGQYPVNGTYPGDNKYLPSNGTGIITVIVPPVVIENNTKPVEDIISIHDNETTDDVVEIPENPIEDVPVEVPVVENVPVEVPVVEDVPVEVPEDTSEVIYVSVEEENETVMPLEEKQKIPVTIIVGNITAKPLDDIAIPISVIPEDGSVFNGNVTVTLPDGTVKVVEIINGFGIVNWTVPENYSGLYPVGVTFDGDDTYLAADGLGYVNVIVDSASDIAQAQEDNAQQKDSVISMSNKTTGNPLFVLLLVLMSVGIIRRKH